jgi:hypothetical protein
VRSQRGEEGCIRPWNPDGSAQNRLVRATRPAPDRSIGITRTLQGHGLLGQTCRENVGKGHLPAGAGSNLHRPLDISVVHEMLVEGGGLAHEPVGAMTKG